MYIPRTFSEQVGGRDRQTNHPEYSCKVQWFLGRKGFVSVNWGPIVVVMFVHFNPMVPPSRVQTVLQEAVAVGERETVVCARFLVPDTNGFVDQLGSIRALVECGHFVLAVPLIGELD